MTEPIHEPSNDVSRRRLLSASLLLTPLGLTACAHPVASAPPMPLPDGLRAGEQHPFHLVDPNVAADAAGIANTAPYPRMQMAIPAGYGDGARPWPLLVFLHGAGERGSDIEDVKRGGPPMLADRGVAYPMLVCSPQVDPGMRWQPARLHALVAALRQRFAIDERRVTATGLSLGGSGVWRWACDYPQDLAAIAPVCGWVDPAAVAAMRRVPVRGYHGELDPLVPLARQQASIDELRRQGGSASFKVYAGVGHDAWTAAYEDPALVPWLLAQVRPGR